MTVALPGAHGKPRPALLIQSDLFDEHPSVTILPVTGEVRDTGSTSPRAPRTACANPPR